MGKKKQAHLRRSTTCRAGVFEVQSVLKSSSGKQRGRTRRLSLRAPPISLARWRGWPHHGCYVCWSLGCFSRF
eukprot:2992013-Pleurochrysis_carterae.AAC.1